MNKRIPNIILAIVLVTLLILFRPLVKIEYYYSSHCPSCDKVIPLLEGLNDRPLNDRLKRQLSIKIYNTATERGLKAFHKKLDSLENESLHVGSLPLLFVGDEVFMGTEEITAYVTALDQLLRPPVQQ